MEDSLAATRSQYRRPVFQQAASGQTPNLVECRAGACSGNTDLGRFDPEYQFDPEIAGTVKRALHHHRLIEGE